MEKKVVLINPDSTFLVDPLVFPSLGLLYLSSYLKQHGHEVEVVDLAGGGKLPFSEFGEDVYVYGITATNAQYQEALRIHDDLKTYDENNWVVLGGPRATSEPYSCLQDGFNQAVVGEGERAIVEIAEGCMERIVQMPQIENLDEIPFPDRDAINIHRYHYFLDGMPTANMMTSRGCPFACSFCCKTWGRRARYRSAENVLEEAKLLKEKYKFEAIMFYDDEMLAQKNRDAEIFRGLKELGLIFRCFTRADLVDEKMARLMANNGCKEILIGVESGSDRILTNVRKGTTREIEGHAIRILRDNGIRVKAAFIVGLPGESWESINETEEFIGEFPADDYDFSILQVYPLSHIYEHPEQYDLSFEKFSGRWFKGKPDEYGDVSPIRTSSMSFEEILKARDYLEGKYKRWK